MKLSPKTVSPLIAYLIFWGAPFCAGQSESASPGTQPASGIQHAPNDTPAPREDTPPADKSKAAQSVAEISPGAAVTKSTEPNNAAVGRPADSQKRYVIGPLDVLYIKVWNQAQLSGTVDVRPDGILSMPLIGEVKADGSTAAQLKEAIEARLKDFLNNPEVDVQVAKVNSKRYFVYGGVGRPGEFPLIETTTIMDALSVVGGFKDFAKPTKITIKRGNETFHFNYKDFSKGKNMDKNANIELQNGDRIFVPE
jgi:polysaccharide biosynthesis/export protein